MDQMTGTVPNEVVPRPTQNEIKDGIAKMKVEASQLLEQIRSNLNFIRLN